MQRLSIPSPAPVRADSFPIDNTRQPSGHTVGVDARSLRLDGRRWMPVMGELHYARVPAEAWRAELLKLRAGGISCVATYVFWIHHEELEGTHRWDGERDLGRFVTTARDTGLDVVVRLGPWCHGEVRNGGLPDWVVSGIPGARSDDPVYLAAVRRHFTAIAAQLQGLLWHEGGPIVGFQIENEFGGPAEHLLTIKRLAREAGLLAPLYTRTGWPDLATPMPFGELLPLYGAYAEGFWDRELTAMPNLYPAGFRFNALRTDSAIATDLLGQRDARDFDDPTQYPFLTCELGGGMMSSYHRRIRIDPRDIEAVALVKVGSGGNLPGYYMYHGGVNPEGERTPLQETQATRYWNDLPEKNYDFQAPVGAAGQLREHYHRLRRLHLFVHTFGPSLAGMPAVFPGDRPTQRDDTTTLRWSVRSDGRGGFAFLNNHERLRELPPKDVQLQLALPQGEVTLPAAPLSLPSGACTVWPFNLELAAGVRLDHATAMPLCRIVTCATTTWFFAQTPGVPAAFALNGAPARTLEPGRAPALSLKDAEGEDVQIVLLDDADSLSLWKLPWLGSERVLLTRAGLTIDGDDLRLSSQWASELAVSIYPPLAAGGPRDGVFEPLVLERFTCGQSRVLVTEPVRPHGAVRIPPLGWTTPAVAVAPQDEDFSSAAVWKLRLPADLDTAATPLLRLRYAGDVLRVRLGGRLTLDDFFNGDVVDLDLTRHAAPLTAGHPLEIEILPLGAEAPIHLPAGQRPAAGSVSCALHSAELLPCNTARPTTHPQRGPAARPLFRDPIHDGAADPVVIWNRRTRTWWMFYTNRRAADPSLPEIAWVHGTHLGIAESRDAGATWTYRGYAHLSLPAELGAGPGVTHWAPEIIEHDGTYHMYLTVVPGIFDTWQHPRAIAHLTSTDLEHWTYRSTLTLTSNHVIDACVERLPSGRWRMWYNDEVAGKAINAAESDDLFQWTDLGLVHLPDRLPGEGPNVFRFAGHYWMIVDEWRGQAVYRSEDALAWTRQEGPHLLAQPGAGPDDASFAYHADVVVNDGRAWIFYFTHPERPIGADPLPGANTRRSTVHVAELVIGPDGRLACDRDAPARIALRAP